MYVEIKDYSKAIKGKTVLNHINYNFAPGKIYGLYGRNGSGKTMLMRAIAGLIYPTEGKIMIDGKQLHKDISFPEDTGIIIENMELMPQYDGYTNLKLLAKIRKKATDEDIYEALDKVGLSDAGKKKVRAYSLGMKQKLSIAQAIFEKPQLLLLDEPTNALDEKSVEDVRALLIEIKQRGAIVIIASHNKDDIKYLADVVLEVDRGQIREGRIIK
ncbi:MAG: ABC transporter ATP-binding protein [Lachnospiraceae bacterium]|nr:ABC transporter ATP-binding protein [Lachnospiraceae bacterium]